MELKHLALDRIIQNPDQPRKDFPIDQLEDLAGTYKIVGVAQPILVRPDGAKYIIISGERRWRAAGLAQLQTIPCIVRNDLTSKQESLTRLIENVQRAELSPIETARYILHLKEEEGLTQEEIAISLGSRSNRSAISHYLRLLNLPTQVQEFIENGDLQFGHGKVLCSAPKEQQLSLAASAIEKGMSVRQLENAVKTLGKERGRGGLTTEVRDAIARMELGASEVIGYPIKIEHSEKKNSGKVVVSYSSLDELDGIMHKIGYDGDS